MGEHKDFMFQTDGVFIYGSVVKTVGSRVSEIIDKPEGVRDLLVNAGFHVKKGEAIPYDEIQNGDYIETEEGRVIFEVF